MGKSKRVVVIGAGPSGLCAAKHSIENGYSVTVFEQTAQLGGTWVYTEQTGNDEYGLPIHSSMYQNMVTNLPIETMGFPGYNFPNKGRSFVPHEEVLKFFQAYANDHQIVERIQFEHHVIRTRPLKDNKWEVIVKDLKQNIHKTEYFDYVFVCNGHYFETFTPEFEGRRSFEGKQIHSHDYRKPDSFEGEQVLLIGGGPSGKDIVHAIATKARRVCFSTHRDVSKTVFSTNVSVKPDVKEIRSSTVIFDDGSEENFTTILYCTGYQYSFPFLTVDSDLCVNDGFHVYPLYKHCININHPSMAIIGLQICAYTLMYDMQVKLCFRYWNEEISMPSREEMLKDIREETEKQQRKSDELRKSHLLGVDQTDYFGQLAAAGEMENVDEVIFKIYDDCTELRIAYPNTYRNFNYRIIDNATFERYKINEQ